MLLKLDSFHSEATFLDKRKMNNLIIRKIWIVGCCFLVAALSCENSKNPVSIIDHSEATWELVRESSQNILYRSLCFVDQNNGWVVGQSGIIIHTADGGNTWNEQHGDTLSDYEDVQFINQHVGWIVGRNNTMLKTKDGGEHWLPVVVPDDTPRTIMALSFVDENRGWICDNGGSIYHTTDGCESWTQQLPYFRWTVTDIQFLNGHEGWAITTNKIAFHTTNGGNTWNQVSVPTESDFWPVVCMDIFFLNPQKGWVIGMSASSDIATPQSPLYCTRNGGITWASQSFIESYWITSIVFINERLGWIAGLDKIFCTTNGGKTWFVQNEIKDEVFARVCFVDELNGWALGFLGNIYKYMIKTG